MTKAGHPVQMLEIQYRMHPSIAEYPSQRFYGCKLVTDAAVILNKSHDKYFHRHGSGKFKPFVFHDVFYGRQVVEGTSISNRDEVGRKARLLYGHRVHV